MSFWGKTWEMLLKGHKSVDEENHKKGKEAAASPPSATPSINPLPSQPVVAPKSEVWGYGTFKK